MLANAGFDVRTAGYGNCILDAVTRSEPASLRDAPGVAVECLPVLAQLDTILVDAWHALQAVVLGVINTFDGVGDWLTGAHGAVTVGSGFSDPTAKARAAPSASCRSTAGNGHSVRHAQRRERAHP
ncbi:hypothetical protein [Candidatus Solirubrobacter pratensis]|uniref:hypothetical protein n=1 Tax=Candidatus Solirubrobacter pratensis TaxID=1298857 RepID=UPI0012DCFE07|nr:hypothetical protein [Candidatus Solirubrobacter pratensis]